MKVIYPKYKSFRKIHPDFIQKGNGTLFGRKFYGLPMILLVFFAFVANQTSIGAINNAIEFSRFTNKDGLSNSYINCITQDSAGFIWIGTNDGLNKFANKR